MVNLQTRDKKILAMLSKYGVLSSQQILANCFLGVAHSTAMRRLRRLEEDELIVRQHGLPQAVSAWSLTTEGARRGEFEPPFRYTNRNTIEHDVTLAELRLALEKVGLGHDWVSEMEMKRERGYHYGSRNNDGLIPDGIFVADIKGTLSVIAVELELTPKNHLRYDRLFRQYATKDSISWVWYVVANSSIGETVWKRWKERWRYKGSPGLLVSTLDEVICESRAASVRIPEQEKAIRLGLFNQVQERLTLNRNKFKPDEWKTYPYPLTELLIYGECGKHLGGKSAHGKNRKHFYYGHPRQLNSDGVTHLKRCRLERVRAPRTEEMILKCLKQLAQDPAKIDHWLEIYARGTQTQLPGIEGKLKTLETELQTQAKRKDNLLARLADLPKDIPADLIYGQIQTVQAKEKELETAREVLNREKNQLTSQSIDRDRLLFRIRRTIANLEKTPTEEQRPIFSNLIKFAELHPTKVRLGLYAPALRATGTDGLQMRGCSTKELNGAPGGTRTPTPFGTWS